MTSQLNKGILEYCVLLVLKEGDTHGYEIIQRLKPHFEGLLDSTVYSILRRIEANGYIKSSLVEGEGDRKKKMLTLLDKGRKLCAQYDSDVENLFNVIRALKNK